MATDEQNQVAAAAAPLSPAMRQRLQRSYEKGMQSFQAKEHDYAADMFAQCVIGDLGNLVYAQSFLANLHQKYNNNKKGSNFSGFKGMSARSAVKKSYGKKDWPGTIKAGLEMLRLNPWDVQTLLHVATAAYELGHEECQLFYLKAAIDANPKDIDANRQAANALKRMGQFDQAIACWVRVDKVKPGDEEAKREIDDLYVEKTKSNLREQDADDEGSDSPAKATAARPTGAAEQPARLSPEDRLKRAMETAPDELGNYLELAELYTQRDEFEPAERTLTTALDVSGGDVKIRERLEDLTLRRVRHNLMIAEKRALEQKTEESQSLLKRMAAEANRQEIEVYRARSDRYPSNTQLKFELGVRLKKAGSFNEAIKSLQEARNDGKRKAAVLVELGECFQYIKQYRLAMTNYGQALEHLGEKDDDVRKLALYRAGVLAMGMKDFDAAEQHLTELAGLDFGYKDVSERLDKLAQARHKE